MEPQSYLGGQALFEGVMMRGGDKVAIAVRKPDRSIHVEVETRSPLTRRYPFLGLPVIRGTVVLFDSLITGYRALNRSANLSAEGEDGELTPREVFLSLLVSIALGVALFILLPLYGAKWLTGAVGAWFAAVEGCLRLSIFFLYIRLISQMRDVQRVFGYHGAEHKTINCYEAKEELTVENVRRHSLIHKRCGTSFLLFVMLISIVLFSFVSGSGLGRLEMILSRLALLPVVAGLAYELIRFSGSTTNRFVTWLAGPGLWMQKLTTREPDDGMIEVAIASVKAVLQGGRDSVRGEKDHDRTLTSA
jgi:uncharacterized protein YqhQ